jgi:hypothetical protein
MKQRGIPLSIGSAKWLDDLAVFTALTAILGDLSLQVIMGGVSRERELRRSQPHSSC